MENCKCYYRNISITLNLGTNEMSGVVVTLWILEIIMENMKLTDWLISLQCLLRLYDNISEEQNGKLQNLLF